MALEKWGKWGKMGTGKMGTATVFLEKFGKISKK
jgi:hypothetical protein